MPQFSITIPVVLVSMTRNAIELTSNLVQRVVSFEVFVLMNVNAAEIAPGIRACRIDLNDVGERFESERELLFPHSCHTDDEPLALVSR